MSDALTNRLLDQNFIDQKPEHFPEEGNISNKSVEKLKNQTTKGWYIAALVVCSVVVLGGIFGTIGLFQSQFHFLPSSFDWLATAIKFVGNTPHSWSLWALAAGGLLGGAAMGFSSVKVHQARMEDKRTENEVNPPPPDEIFNLGKEGVLPDIYQMSEQTFEAMLGDNFAELGVDPSSFNLLSNTYSLFHLHNGDPKQFIVRRTPEGLLQCTKRISIAQRDNLNYFLYNTKKYVFQAELPARNQ